MKKEYIIGGLAIVGGLSLLAYLTSKPRRNSEGFFNARGTNAYEVELMPSNFIRKGGFPFGCALYARVITPLGNKYFKRTFTKPNQIGFEVFPITKQQFVSAFNSMTLC
jgi:hypothetical protein